MPIVAGTYLDRYKILIPLGEGGMGEVYLALDTALDRKVALKMLPTLVTKDDPSLRRFEQEARAVSALNHPNILTIYEIGHEGPVRFIVTEFIDGVTLRDHMASTQMRLDEVLDVAMQVASALSAAHTAGIIHRDIKPENIMLRRDGYVKVLDFGLAKLMGQRSPSDPEGPTLINTDPGVVLGTIIYMSPEQTRGLEVDGRTDIWSLGVVIHEMISGDVPFKGPTKSDVIVSILDREPMALGGYAAGEVPPELERIVGKALRKNREDRYQTAKDLALDLKSLKQELELEAKREHSAPFLSGARTAAGNNPVGRRSAQQQAASAAMPATLTGEAAIATARRISSAEYIVSKFKRHRRGAGLAMMALTVLMLAGIAYFYSGGGRKDPIDSVAVLPFVNVGGDPEAEFLSDGITESLISSLSQLTDLTVKSGSSVFRYKGRQTEPEAIGRELGVSAVLTGKVIQRGTDLSITAELVDVRNSNHLWGGQYYNRKINDILEVQQQISQEISQQLRLRLTGEEQKRLTKRYTENTEAYQLYLKGRYFLNRRSADGIEKALGYFQQAIALDPNYALAYAGLADSYFLQTAYTNTPPGEAYPRAKAAAAQALALDDTLAEAHTSLAQVKFRYDWDWTGAEREFKRAIELTPSYATAHHWYGEYLALLGRADEGIAKLKRAQELDPLSLIISADLGLTFFYARRYEQSIEQYNKTLRTDPNFAAGHVRLGRAFEQKRMYPEAIAEFQKALALSGGSPERLALLGHAYAVSGNIAEAQNVLEQLKGRGAQPSASPIGIAIIYAGLGDKDQALRWLEKAYEERSGGLVHLKVDPVFDSLRSDIRFQELMRRINLSP